jgi:hypothetical protein
MGISYSIARQLQEVLRVRDRALEVVFRRLHNCFWLTPIAFHRNQDKVV